MCFNSIWPNIPLAGICASQFSIRHETGLYWQVFVSCSNRSLAINLSSQPIFPHFLSTTFIFASIFAGRLSIFELKSKSYNLQRPRLESKNYMGINSRQKSAVWPASHLAQSPTMETKQIPKILEIYYLPSRHQAMIAMIFPFLLLFWIEFNVEPNLVTYNL